MTIDKKPLAKLAKTRPLAIGRLLLLSRRDFVSRVTLKMSAMGLGEVPPPLLTVLPYIDLEGTRSTELAQRAGVSKQAVGKLVKTFEIQGFLTRSVDASDGRAFLVSLTETGLELLYAIHISVEDVEKEYDALLGSAELKRFRETLVKIAYGSKPRALTSHRASSPPVQPAPPSKSPKPKAKRRT
jgi:DNA-binding MarR family transcriptional regulator